MNSEDLTRKGDSDVKRKERIEVKNSSEEVCNNNFEFLVKKVGALNDVVVKKFSESAEDVRENFERIEQKMDAIVNFMKSLVRNDKLVMRALAEVGEKKIVETGIETINEEDFDPDYEVQENEETQVVRSISLSEKEASDENVKLKMENKMRKRLKKEREKEDKKAEVENKIRTRIIKKLEQKEQDKRRIQAITEEMEKFKVKKPKNMKRKHSELGKPQKKESEAEMKTRIRQELKSENTPVKNRFKWSFRSGGRAVYNLWKGSEGFNGPAVYYWGRRGQEDEWSRSWRNDRRSISARRISEGSSKRMEYEDGNYGY